MSMRACSSLALALLAACSADVPMNGARPVEGPPVVARAEPRAALSPEGAQAWRILRDAERFTDDAIYDGGTTPVEVRAWRWLMREPQAGAAFAQLLEAATLPGRLYALCGLYYSDPAGFATAVEPYRASDATLFFQTGCVGLADMPVAELIEARRMPAIRLASRDESIEAWTRRTANAEGYQLDILGGGYPSLFREGGGWQAVELEDLHDPDAR
jgi:hypothetical protein